MAVCGYQAFARSARSIALLEGECTRLRTLLDHFRGVNAKLIGDVKAAHEQVSKRIQHACAYHTMCKYHLGCELFYHPSSKLHVVGPTHSVVVLLSQLLIIVALSTIKKFPSL